MEDKIFQTGMLLMVVALIMRKYSKDDADQVEMWWKLTVVSTFAAGTGAMFVSALMMIWL